MAGNQHGAPGCNSYAPGYLVRHPQRADWGVGRVQSAIGVRVTVNFQHAGKQMIDVSVVELEIIDVAEG